MYMAAQLHDAAICSARMRRNGSHQAIEPTNLGCPHKSWIQHWYSDGASSLFPRVHCKTRAARVSNVVFFKYQYITNPQITLETLLMKAATELTSALKGMISHDAEQQKHWQRSASYFTK
jgi:hypothetical protein